MPRRPSSTPTEGELEILRVLWDRGPSTVRQVHNVLKDRRDTGYSTTLRMVQVMTDKGLLQKDDSVRPQVYTPAQPQEKTQLQLVDYLIQRGFAGSARSLVLRAAAARRITPQELAQIKRMVEKARGSSHEP
jgi:BlaI family penicillinase repressor